MSTPTEDTGFIITGPIVASCIIIAIILDLGFLAAITGVEPSKRANTWWFFITAMVTFLVGDFFTFGYDKLTKRLKMHPLVPVKFGLFCLGIFFGALFGEYVLQTLASGFNSLTQSAYVEFFLLNFIPSFFLILDFFKHEKAHRRPQENPF